MSSLYLSFVSITTLRILTWSWGLTVCPLIVNGLCVASEVDYCRLMYIKCRTAACLPIEGIPDDGFDPFPITPRRRSCDSRCEVVDKGYRTAMTVDSSLRYQVCVEEEEQNRG